STKRAKTSGPILTLGDSLFCLHGWQPKRYNLARTSDFWKNLGKRLRWRKSASGKRSKWRKRRAERLSRCAIDAQPTSDWIARWLRTTPLSKTALLAGREARVPLLLALDLKVGQRLLKRLHRRLADIVEVEIQFPQISEAAYVREPDIGDPRFSQI